jgi:lipopolysaccharide transport system permease protein
MECAGSGEGDVRMIQKATADSLPLHIYIPQSSGLPRINWRELWIYRELLFFLTWRDIKIRYKQAALGVGWAVLQPLLTMVIFSIVFGRLANLPSEGIPYPVFSFAALLPWQLFSSALTRAGTSLVSNTNLITKVYFPRIIIPLSAVAAGFVDFLISFVILIGMILVYRIQITWALLTLPLMIILALLCALSVGLWLSALNVQYRDFQYVIPFLVQAWMYASPVAYSIELIPAGIWRTLYGLNPLVGVIQGFRWALFGGTPPDMTMLISVGVVIFLLITGLIFFRKMEDGFADVI